MQNSLLGPLMADNCFARFAQACRSDRPPTVAELRDWLGAFPPDERPDALVDLVGKHLRSSWAGPARHRLEDYVAEFGPEFAEFRSLADLPPELIEAEFIARHEWGPFADHPAPDEYEKRFPGQARALEAVRARCLDGERYALVRQQGEGGLGMVWYAYDRHLCRYVAIKEPHPARGEPDAVLRQLAEEARVTAGLDHPAIVTVHELRQPNQHLPFFVMRLVQGQRLHDAIRDFHAAPPGAERHLRWNRLLEAFATVCDAVAYAHSRGVLHRDLKPQNVVLGAFGETVVLDWGLARPVGAVPELPARATVGPPSELGLTTAYDTPGHQSATSGSPGQVAGTLSYMAPEQALGRADQRSDVFGLGAILYEILTGRAPYVPGPGEDATAVLRRAQVADYPPPRAPAHAPAAREGPLAAICLKAMRREPVARYAGPAELARDVRLWLADEPVSCYREPLYARPARWARRHSSTTAALVAVLVCLLAASVAGGWWHQRDRDRRQREHDEVQREVGRLAGEAEELLQRGEHGNARARAIEARARLEGRPGLVDLDERLRHILGRAEARLRLDAFLEGAGEAEYHLLGRCLLFAPTQESESGKGFVRLYERGPDLRKGMRLAEKALANLGLPDNPGPVQELAAPARARAAELLLLWGLGLEQEQGQASERAVRLFDAAEATGRRSRFLYEQRARLRRERGDEPGAEEDLRKAKGPLASTFLDHRWRAAEAGRRGQWDRSAAACRDALALRPNEVWALFRLAYALQHLGQTEGAREALQGCKGLRPNDPTTCNESGVILSNLGLWAEAAREFEEAIRIDPDYRIAYGNLIRAHAERERPREAAEVLRRYLARKPTSAFEKALAHTNMGLAFDRVKDKDSALKEYTRALELDPEHLMALRNRSIVLRERGHFAEAEVDVRKAVELRPRNAELWYVRGFLLEKWGRFPDAVAAYSEALKLEPRMVEARSQRGALYRKSKQYDKALRDVNEVLKLRPTAEAHYERAMLFAVQEEYRAALRELDLLVLTAKEPDVKWLRMRGEMKGRLGDLRGSEDDLSAALKLAPENGSVSLNRGVTRMRLKRWSGAIDDFQRYLTLAPKAVGRAGILNDVGEVHRQLGQYDKAVKALSAAIALGPHAGTYLNRGQAFSTLGRLAEAADDFSAAIRHEPGKPDGWFLRAQARLRQGRPDDAARDLDKALERRPDDTETLLFRGLTQQVRGKPAEARRDLLAVVHGRPTPARGHLARGLLHLEDRSYALALADLSQVVNDPLLGPFARLPRARAWLGMGPAGVPGAVADADALVRAWPRDAFAHLGAAGILARAAQGNVKAAAALHARAFTLLSRAVELEPGLRKRLAEGPDLEALRADPRFKRLAGG